MTSWTPEDLAAMDGVAELGIASRRPDGSLRPFVTVWFVRAGDDLFVRSAYGHENPWFQRALAAGDGRIRVAGVEHDVAFEAPGPDVAEAVSDAFRARYGRWSRGIVKTVVSAEAVRWTLQLVPR